MREIKFRAWDKNTNFYADMIRNMDLGPDGVDCIVDNYGINLDVSGECELEQYTGLKGVNDKEIYEGDVVKVFHNSIDTVVFRRGCFGLDANFGHPFTPLCTLDGSMEVIGNVHENPELLEG